MFKPEKSEIGLVSKIKGLVYWTWFFWKSNKSGRFKNNRSKRKIQRFKWPPHYLLQKELWYRLLLRNELYSYFPPWLFLDRSLFFILGCLLVFGKFGRKYPAFWFLQGYEEPVIIQLNISNISKYFISGSFSKIWILLCVNWNISGSLVYLYFYKKL
jgi:hypothetical protein